MCLACEYDGFGFWSPFGLLVQFREQLLVAIIDYDDWDLGANSKHGNVASFLTNLGEGNFCSYVIK